MPSKLRKALGAVKDQTSISLAKVSNKRTSLDIAVLKATTHVETPIDERYVNEILEYITLNKNYSCSCAHTIAKRIGKTRNWVVALKSLMLVLRIFQDGDPYFPREVLHAMKRGAKILSLVNFRDDSNSCPWEYTTFVRTFSLYLDERLHCFLTGKLQRKFDFREGGNGAKQKRSSRHGKYENVKDMKPAVLVDRISNWQKLLDRAMGTKPTGAANTNSLIHNALYAVVQESFYLYHDISEGLTFLLDSFFHLQYQSCVSAFQICIKASKQFVELQEFYDLCKSIGVGRTSEYPSVQKVSDELIQTLQEFLKDQSSFHDTLPSNQPSAIENGGVRSIGSTSERIASYKHSEVSELTERYSDFGSRTTSLEDFFSATETGASPSPSVDFYLDRSNRLSQQSFRSVGNGDSEAGPSQSRHMEATSNSSPSFFDDWPEVPSSEQANHSGDRGKDHADKTNTTVNLLDDWHEVGIQNLNLTSRESSKDGWELALLETAKQPIETSNAPPFLDSLFDQASVPEPHNNPFLQDAVDEPTQSSFSTSNELMLFPGSGFSINDPPVLNVISLFPEDGAFPVTSTFPDMPAPTFRADTPSAHYQNDQFSYDDPFGDSFSVDTSVPNDQLAIVNSENVLQQQKKWLEHQNKIIAKHIASGR